VTQPPQQPAVPARGPYYGPPPAGYYGPPPGYPAYLPPPPALSPAGVPLADFGSRLLAAIIDGAIAGGVSLVVAFPVAFIFIFSRMNDVIATDPYTGEPDSSVFFTDFFLPVLLFELGLVGFMLVLYYVYHVEMLFRSGQTLGKKIMKIRIVPIDPSATLTRGMATKRYLIEFPAAMLVPFFSYLDGLWQLWDKPYQQTLHDKVARTVVIKVFP